MLGDSIRRRRGGKGTGARPAPRRRRPRTWGGFPWRRWIVTGLAVTLAAFAIGYAFAVLVLFPAPPAPSDQVEVPRLVGGDAAAARTALEGGGLHLGETRTLPSDQPPGTVLAQSTLAGQHLLPGASVDIAVATPPRPARVPPVEGLGADAAAALLQAAGLDAQQQTVASDATAGTVVRARPAPGSAVSRPGPVTLFVSQGPPQTLGPPLLGTPVPDTSAAAGAGGGPR